MDLDALQKSRKEPGAFAETLTSADIQTLIPLLAEKNDDLRYGAFLVLRERSRRCPDVYPFWEVFAAMLEDPSSYRRNIALQLLAENVRWDGEKKFRRLFPNWMEHCADKKFITCRQALQSIPIWSPYSPELAEEAAGRLLQIEVAAFRESQQKLILTDLLDALLALRSQHSSSQIESYFFSALESGLLDQKTKKRFQTAWEQSSPGN